MTRAESFAVIGLLLAAAVGHATPASQVHGKQITLNLDFFDICIGTDAWDMSDHRGEMERLMAAAAHYGVDRVLFRVSVCGAVCYHSKVMYVADDRSFAGRTAETLDTCVGDIPSYLPNMAKLLRETDPLADCVELGHKYGMRVWAWLTVYDSMYYAPEGEFFHDNPQYTWVSRDGTKRIPGVPCYAYPEVREYRLRQVKELLAYGVDGLYMSMRSHSPWPTDVSGSREYGYNEPVIEEYKRRYGSDPRDAQPDSLAQLRFVKLKGEFLKLFLRQAHGLCEARGKKLAMNTGFGDADPLSAGRMYVPADDLCRERVVDELSVITSAAADLTRWRVLGGDQVKITTWTNIHGRTYEDSHPKFFGGLQQMLRNSTTHGTCFHEMANVVYLNLWHDIPDAVAGYRAEG